MRVTRHLTGPCSSMNITGVHSRQTALAMDRDREGESGSTVRNASHVHMTRTPDQ